MRRTSMSLPKSNMLIYYERISVQEKERRKKKGKKR
jgi:hypothetical protein